MTELELEDLLASILNAASDPKGPSVQGLEAPMQNMETLLQALLEKNPQVAEQIAPLLQQTQDMNGLMAQMAEAERGGDTDLLSALSKDFTTVADFSGFTPETDPICLALEQALEEAEQTGNDAPLSAALDQLSGLNTLVGQFGMPPLILMLTHAGRSLQRLNLFLDRGADAGLCAEDGYSALHALVDHTSPSDPEVAVIAARLVEAGADPETRDAYGWTPVLRACVEGSLAELSALLNAGASANAVCPPGAPCGTGGKAALLVAAASPDKVACLLDHGALVDPDLLSPLEAELARETEDSYAPYYRGLEASRDLIRRALPR